MRNKTLTTVYAVFCTLLLIGGGVACFLLALTGGTSQTVQAVIGIALGIIFAPIVHELGHVVFAKTSAFAIAYVKAFCFAWQRKGKKLRFFLVSPFTPDETQAVPKYSENMLVRACKYTLGGLIFGGVLWFALLLASVLVTLFYKPNFLLWGASIYTGYLFLLNVLPLEYGGGKTDTAVCVGLKKGYDEERVMLAAMFIQGEVYSGKRYGEIEEKYYLDVPVLAEDQPLFALILQLRYRYFVDKELWKNAAETLNRLAGISEYLTEEEYQRVCAELVFMHSLNAGLDSAEDCGQHCKTFLASETAMAKRVLATFSAAFGEKEKAKTLQESGFALLENEWIVGEKLWEEKLLTRLQL